MSSRKIELRRLKKLIKIANDTGDDMRACRRSGGIPGLGGDLINEDMLIEEKPEELMTAEGRNVWDKIEQEAIERGRLPVLVHGGLMTVRLSDGLFRAIVE